MQIVEIRHKTAPIASAMRNAYIDFSKMTVSVVAILTDVWIDGHQVVGYGFHSNGRYAQPGPLSDRLIPRLVEAPPATLLDDSGSNFDPERMWDVMMANEKPGGHGERSVAVGTLDMAIWDARCKIEGRPLYAVLADRYGDGATADETVFVYAAGGYYYPNRGIDELRSEISGYLESGYRVVKLKIGGASLREDIARIEAVIDLVGESSRVAVDANGRFDLPVALEYAKAIEPYGLFWYEEPGDPLDYELQAALAKSYVCPLATGENLFSMQDARNLVRYSGMRPDLDYLQMDPVLSYGMVEYARTIEMLRSQGWSTRRLIPHGGHQMALHIAAALHLGGSESYPGLFQPFGQFAEGIFPIDSKVRLPELPGIGYEANPKLMDVLAGLSS